MIGKKLFDKNSDRLEQIMGTEEPFGGRHVIALVLAARQIIIEWLFLS